MQDIFVECEILFRTKTWPFTSSLKDLVIQSLKNITINSNFNDILSVDIHMKREFRINLLEHILTLYFRIQAFSFAKDVREKHEAVHKALRKRSLRTNRNQKGYNLGQNIPLPLHSMLFCWHIPEPAHRLNIDTRGSGGQKDIHLMVFGPVSNVVSEIVWKNNLLYHL